MEPDHEEEVASGGENVVQQVKRMPTPKEVMKGLNEFVIGQKKVKIALSVGVYNHYKRIFVAEAQAAAESRRMATQDSTDTSFLPLGGEGSSLQDLNLGQYGSAVKGREDDSGYCETPDINGNNGEEERNNDNNSISSDDFGRDVEDCEIEKSNILLLGPTGSGKSRSALYSFSRLFMCLWHFSHIALVATYSGKTLLVKTLARLIDVPLVIADATCLTQAGYVGEDVESVLLSVSQQFCWRLNQCCFGGVSQPSILFLRSFTWKADKTSSAARGELCTLMNVTKLANQEETLASVGMFQVKVCSMPFSRLLKGI